MKYAIKKESTTAKRIIALAKKGKECEKEAWKLAKDLGASAIRGLGGFTPWGGISYFDFSGNVPEGFIKTKWGYHPNKRTVRGRELKALVDALPKIRAHELNAIINMDDCPFHLGIDFLNKDFLLIDLGNLQQSWCPKAKLPKDMIEIYENSKGYVIEYKGKLHKFKAVFNKDKN